MLIIRLPRKVTNEILQEPNRRLRVVSKRVKIFGTHTRNIVRKLNAVTRKVDRPWNLWLGMAAPQIGYKKRIIVLKSSFRNYTLMINAEVLEKRWLLPSIERCFSLADKGVYLLKRYFWLKVKYQDLSGRYHFITLTGIRAYTIQQEIDHLNGKLICDY